MGYILAAFIVLLVSAAVFGVDYGDGGLRQFVVDIGRAVVLVGRDIIAK